MPPLTNEQQGLLENIRKSYPQLYNYPDEEILTVYNRKQGEVGGITPTGMSSIAQTEYTPPSADREPPQFEPRHVEEYVGVGERFAKRAWEAFVPFGMYEPELEEAEGFAEHLAGALGGGVGFVLGAFPLAALTGGVSIPLKAARGINLVSKITKRARMAEKAGKKGYKSLEETVKFLDAYQKAKPGKLVPQAFSLYNKTDGMGNIIGKSKNYIRAIESIAARGEGYVKWAKAMDIGVRNFATFGAYGQLHMKPGSTLDERWNQLKVDTVTSAAFTGLGTVGTRVLSSNATGDLRKAVLGGEFLAMFGAGAFMSDLGQTDMPWEERLAHGTTLALMHGVTIGMDRVDRREALVDVFVHNGETIAEAKKRAYGRTVDDIDNKAVEFVKSSPTLFVDKRYLRTKKKVKNGKTVERPYIGDYLIHRVKEVIDAKKTKDNPKGEPYIEIEHFKPKRGEGEVTIGEQVVTAKGRTRVERIRGETIEDAQIKFQDKYTPFRKAAPREMPPEVRTRAKLPRGPLKRELKEAEKARAEAGRIKRIRSTEESAVELDYEVVPASPYRAKKTGNPFALKLYKKDSRGYRMHRRGAYDKMGEILDPSIKEGFKTKRQAKAWAEKNWKGEEGSKFIESEYQIRRELYQKREAGSLEYKDYTKAKKQAARELRKSQVTMGPQYGAQSFRLQNIVDTFFPEAGRDFNNLNTYELKALRGLLRTDGKGDFVPEHINIIPPSEIHIGAINRRWMKFAQWANASLPIYTILDAAGPYGKRLATRMMNWSSIQRKNMGLSQSFSKLWNKQFSGKELEIMQKEIDSKFEGARAGEHAKTVERMKNEEITVEMPTEKTKSEKLADGTEVVYADMEKRTMSKYDYAKYLVDSFHDRFAINQALYEVKVADTRGRKAKGKREKLKPYLEVLDTDGKKINLRDVDSEFDLMAILKKEKGKGSTIEINGEDVTIGKVTENHYVKDFFHRKLTDSFWDLINSGKDGEGVTKYLIGKIMKADKRLTEAEAMEQLRMIQELKENNKLDGQTFMRVADIDPYIYYGRDGVIIDTKVHYNKEGLPFKRGDILFDEKTKKEVKVGDVIQTYSTNSLDIINRYAEKTAKSIASYGAYGGREGLAKDLPEKGFYVKTERVRMMKDIERAGGSTADAIQDAIWFNKLAGTVMRDQVNGRNYDYPFLGDKLGPAFEKFLSGSTKLSATIGLSSPLSGIKNLALGQVQLVVLSGRGLLSAYTRLLTKPGEWTKSYNLAKEVGALYSGVYDLFIKPATPLKLLYTKQKGIKGMGKAGIGLSQEMLLKAGMMRPTEMFNRIIASMMGPRIMEVQLDNLMGVKNFSTAGISKQTSRRIMEELMRFTPKQIDDMIAKRKVGNGHPGWTEEQRLWAADRAHTITQGVGEYPYIPYIMGRKGFRPLTLFYRIAYRMTDNIAKNVIKPATREGNIWPMMKYVGLSIGGGKLLYSMYWYAFGEERKNKFKDAPAEYWTQFIRAEGLGVMSNAFDEYGSSISDAYVPVVLRNYLDLTREALHIMHGEKRPEEGIKSLLKKTVSLYGSSQRVYKNLSKSSEKRVTDSKRRQSQFLDVYFKKYDSGMDEGDALTRNSPYYEAIRDVFWLDEPKDKAHNYYSALNYLTHMIQRENAALAKNEMMAYKEAKKRIKNIVSRMRPIPSSWRDRKKGDRTTKYRVYMSKITPEQVKEELELEQLYKQKVNEFRSAVAQYR